MTGLVLGMVETAVKPPATAAARPVWSVSDASPPGSRKCTWISTNPGATTLPRASSVSSAPASRFGPISRITPVFNANVQHPVEIVFGR